MTRAPMIKFRYGKRPFPPMSVEPIHKATTTSTQSSQANTFSFSSGSSATSARNQYYAFKDLPAQYRRPKLSEYEIAIINAGGAVDPPKPATKSKK